MRGKRNYFLTRVLWSARIEVVPSHFASFRANLLLHGSLFAVSWAAVMWLFSWHDDEQSASTWLLWSAIVGGLQGMAMAAYYRWSARKHNLPAWDELPDVVDVFD